MQTKWSIAPVNRALMPVLCVGLLQVYGCSSGGLYGKLFGDKTVSEQADEQGEAPPSTVGEPYYTARDAVRLYAEPRFSAARIATLPRHQKVQRFRQQSGFAYVKVEGSGQMGWLENALLIWRLPDKAASPGKATSPAAAPAMDSKPTPTTAPAAPDSPLDEDEQRPPSSEDEEQPGAQQEEGAPGADVEALAVDEETAPAPAAVEDVPPPAEEGEVNPSRFDLF